MLCHRTMPAFTATIKVESVRYGSYFRLELTFSTERVKQTKISTYCVAKMSRILKYHLPVRRPPEILAGRHSRLSSQPVFVQLNQWYMKLFRHVLSLCRWPTILLHPFFCPHQNLKSQLLWATVNHIHAVSCIATTALDNTCHRYKQR